RGAGDSAISDLVSANRILAREGVLDAFGHVSIRDSNNSGRFLMARSRAPELVTKDDIMEFGLDSIPIDQRGRDMYGERYIHGCIYEARPDVNAVIHSHTYSLLSFGVAGVPIKPVWHMAAAMGPNVPIWDSQKEFGDTDLLVNTTERGRSFAEALGNGAACLMRGHGATVATSDIKSAVFIVIYMMVNADIAREAGKI